MATSMTPFFSTPKVGIHVAQQLRLGSGSKNTGDLGVYRKSGVQNKYGRSNSCAGT